MNNRPILFYDSGIGGMSYLFWLREKEQGEKYVYFADTGNFPYGEKSSDTISEIVVRQMGRLIRKTDPKMAVIACNTASVTALEKLRRNYRIPFIGTVPAIKPAAVFPQTGSAAGGEYPGQGNEKRVFKIGLIATRRTVRDNYTERLIMDFASHCEIIRYGAAGLVNFVEREYIDSTPEERIEVLTPIADFFKKKGVDSIVLGCTHFIFLKDELKSLMGKDVRIIDSVEGVGKQVRRILDNCGRRTVKDDEYDFFLNTGGKPDSIRALSDFAGRFSLKNGGTL